MTFTPNQFEAITAPGNLLVIAAAGAGKTGTLVERCVGLLFRADDPASIRQVLVVTFTEAAAAEVRGRIRKKLEAEVAKNPADERLQEQLTQIDSASISTLHSFCFELIRKHVLQLELDPAVAILEPQQSKVLFHHTLDLLLEEHYKDEHDFSGALKEVIHTHFGGWDQPLRAFVQRLHEFTQARPAPVEWFEQTVVQLSRSQCPEWHQWYAQFIQEWRDWWLPYLRSLPVENINAHACACILEEACAKADISVAEKIADRDRPECWMRRMGKDRPAVAKLFDEAGFLASLCQTKAGDHPLDEDWRWMREPLLILLRFAQQFTDKFTAEKRERGVLDFHDLEQLALRLLVDPASKQSTPIARDWQQKFKAIFVDEYQDINAAQDLILSALSSEIAPGNRFLVGDRKQSIYRFRQADPHIFGNYLTRPGWRTVHLTDNFRSHERILDFVNPLFAWLMRPALGGLRYDEAEYLRFGGKTDRPEMAATSAKIPPVELHVLFTSQRSPAEGGENDSEEDPADLENAEIEARLVATSLGELKKNEFTIFHERENQRRAVDWKDMVVLLRAPRNKVELYARAFAEAGVPLQTRRDAFFTTPEVLDLCNLLTILDNPLQDIPLVGVLRSPMAGLNAQELAGVRRGSNQRLFWNALREFHHKDKDSAAGKKITRFLNHFAGWRDSRRCFSLAQRLETILQETGYGDWLLTQPRGRERSANVQQLLRIARQFDESRGQSLYLFLQHLEELQEAAGDIEPEGAVEENAVRLMSIHQSKGLEFPVVAVADLGKRFNFADQSAGLMLHEKFGLCSMIKPPHTGQRYPSLPLWLARHADRREALGEEMRVLYVALTRAQNHLLLFGSTSEKSRERWTERANPDPHPQDIGRHLSLLDWVGTYLSVHAPGWSDQRQGSGGTFSFHFHEEGPMLAKPEPVPLRNRAAFTLAGRPYRHEAATRQAAKTSVTALRQKYGGDEETARPAVRFRTEKNGAERGRAIHTFLEHFELATAHDESLLRLEADRLVQTGFLTADQREHLDFESITSFWSSPTGRELLRQRAHLQRELPFTFRATRGDFALAGMNGRVFVPDDEFIVIQGVADLVLLGPAEIWLIDFKSDRLEKSELTEGADRYKSQVLLYAMALSAIYRRPVTRKGIFFLNARVFEWFKDETAAPSSGQLIFSL